MKTANYILKPSFVMGTTVLLGLLLLPGTAQNQVPEPTNQTNVPAMLNPAEEAPPAEATPAETPAKEPPPIDQPAEAPPPSVAPKPSPPPTVAPEGPVGPTAAPTKPTLAGPDGVRMNFQGAALSDVLNYLSETAGLVIVQEGEITGTVNVLSHQPLNAEESVDLLNTILLEKGYVAIRNGRILKIVSRDKAHMMDLPVRTGADPQEIPKKEEMVTQIIPVRYADALKLIENLSPLLGEESTITANESSNAILLTDTLTNIRRMVEIIHALDTSISGISSIRVFPLQYADATQLAQVIQDLFSSTSQSSSRRTGGRGGRSDFMERFRMGGGEGRGGSASASEARQAAARVVAVADERSNSLVVSAPEELMPTITQLVTEMDTSITDPTEVRVFKLENADAMELADIITELFSDTNSQNNNSSRFGGFRPPWMPPGQDSSRGQSGQRTLVQSKVVAVGDRRTNALLISAPRQMMSYIAEMIGRLDATAEKKQQVFVVPLEHADVDNVAAILRGMFEEQGVGSRGTGNTQAVNPLTDRTATGASSDITSSFGGRRSTR